MIEKETFKINHTAAYHFIGTEEVIDVKQVVPPILLTVGRIHAP